MFRTYFQNTVNNIHVFNTWLLSMCITHMQACQNFFIKNPEILSKYVNDDDNDDNADVVVVVWLLLILIIILMFFFAAVKYDCD